MGLRAYLLVKVDDSIEQGEFTQAVKEVERVPGVEFVDPVIGTFDMMVMVNAPATVESIAAKIQDTPWFEDIEILKLINIFSGV